MVINHQDYIKLPHEDGKEAHELVFEDSKLISDLIDALVLILEEAPIVGDKPDKKFLVILDSHNNICDQATAISEYTSSSSTLTLDYKDHVVLQFTTVNAEEQVESKFKFIPFADVITGTKIILNSTKKDKAPLKELIKYDDVVSESMKKDVAEKSFFG